MASRGLHSNAHRPKANVAQVKRCKCYAKNQHKNGLERGISYGMVPRLLGAESEAWKNAGMWGYNLGQPKGQ